MPPVPSWSQLPTGNGFGFQVFDANAKEVTQFLERPYRYLRPGLDPHGTGIERRNLAFDVYFGLRAGTSGAWLRDLPQTSAGYVNQNGIIQSNAVLNGVNAESYYFAPFGYSGNALVMIVHAVNNSGAAATVDAFANPNFHLGTATDPNAPGIDGESIATTSGVATETGAGGGVMVYTPIGGFDKADCSGTGYMRVKMGQDLIGTPQTCTGSDLTIEFQKSLGTLQPGQSAWWGLAIEFVADPTAVAAAQTNWSQFLAGRAADKVLSDAESEWEAWRKPPPAGLADGETRIWRQAETTLRMSQVLEPYSETPKQKGYGMILASLPPGQWHIGWVRDAQYSTVALARMGHFAEARRALEFFLNAEANQYQSYVGAPYRISITRYFGDGQEESDWNADGPNIELDGWGSYLWAARTYVDASGDAAWLSQKTRAGETIYSVLQSQIAAPLELNLESSTGIVAPDTSIWESHWNQRKHFTYTSLAAARGLCDFAALARASGDGAVADHFAVRAGAIPGAIRAHMVDGQLYLGGSVEGIAAGKYHDGAALEALNWDLFAPGDPLAAAELDGLQKLQVASGGYMRNDNAASSYDSNEWIVIDLRAQSAMRKLGRVSAADALLGWVTSQGNANYDLLPELFNTFASDGPIGGYTGAVPMVGFGAGGYVLALLDRAGAAPEHRDCGSATPPGDGGAPDSGAPDGGMKPSGASGCSISGTMPQAPSSPSSPFSALALAVLAALTLLARRLSVARASAGVKHVKMINNEIRRSRGQKF
ncbi:MAG TPA: glycoside hydrolase family 15 protein [Polyangia bacterium]|nr:glycoside hydrolase family 15 protein [Polyangia bacterium]